MILVYGYSCFVNIGVDVLLLRQLCVTDQHKQKTKFNLHVCFSCRELLGHLTNEQFQRLERALCSAEGLGTLDRKKKDSKKKSANKKVETSSVSTSSQVGASGSAPLDLPASHDPECVFEPRPHGAEGMKITTCFENFYAVCFF